MTRRPGLCAASEGLRKHVDVKRGYRELRSSRDSGRIRVLAADVDTADGVIPTLALVDELHRHKSAGLYGVFRDGLGPRNGRMITISTAGEHEQSALGLMRAAALALPDIVRDGAHVRASSLDGKYVMHEWALSKDDDLDDMQVVKQANPASWQTLEALAARHDSPSMLALAVGAVRVRPVGRRRGLVDRRRGLGQVDLTGADGAGRPDHARVRRLADRGRDGADRLPALRTGCSSRCGCGRRRPAARDWEVPGNEVDAVLAGAMERYRVIRGYFDPPLWRTEIDAWSREFGERVIVRFETARSKMQGAVERFRTDVMAGRLSHSGDEVLTRHVLNAQMREARGGGYWLTKDRPGSVHKIDAAVAAVLAYEARADVLAANDTRSRALVTF